MLIRGMLERRKRVLAASVLVFLVALAPRLVGIGLFLTADEKNWVARSYQFLKAMKEFRINDTLQTTHPGITTLWVSGIATYITTRLIGTPFNFDELHRFVTAAQVPMAIVNALLVVGIFFVSRYLFSPRAALLGSLVIGLNPFLIGLSKVVHVDAFLAGFLVLAALLFLVAEKTGHGWAIVGSAVVGALAVVSKLPGLFIVPFAILVLFGRRSCLKRPEFIRRARFFSAWAFLLAIALLLLWPSLLWVPNPLGNVNLVRRDITAAFVTPHHMEESYTLNPWHYPRALLARTTIPVLLGFILLLLLLPSPKTRAVISRDASLQTVSLLLAFIGGFLLLMLVGAKKGDRYILPVFPVIDLLGTVGVLAGAQIIFRRWSPLRVASVFMIGILAVTVARLGPYALAYYNPLFPPNLSQELGWGEGLDQVARYLDDQSDDVVVASWYPEELRALTRRPVLHINAHEQVRIGYVVLYRNMFGRAPDHWANDFIDEYYKKRTPVFVANVNGLPYAWVYRKPAYTAVLGQLTPERVIIAEFPAVADNLARLDVLTATYGGKATQGMFVLSVRASPSGSAIREARRLVGEIKNNAFTEFSFAPIPDSAGKTYVVFLSAEGTRLGNAPTVRAAPAESGQHYAILKTGAISDQAYREGLRKGIVGLRPFYLQDGKEISHEEATRQ